jgi:hypothetical protein
MSQEFIFRKNINSEENVLYLVKSGQINLSCWNTNKFVEKGGFLAKCLCLKILNMFLII